MSRLCKTLLVAGAVMFVTTAGEAQWITLKTPGLPRLPDGKPDLKAAAPRMSGRPDLTGVWRFNADPYTNNVTVDLKPDEIHPSVVALYKQRLEDLAKDDPSTFRCLPSGPRQLYAPSSWVRIVETPAMIVMLYEDLIYRQIFMDGRALPKDPNPTWMGYSIGRWDGDTLVVESAGFVDNNWLDNNGHPGTESLRLTERFHRRDFGHIDLQMTIDDPKAYVKPWTVNVPLQAAPDSELIEYVCDENERDLKHLVGK